MPEETVVLIVHSYGHGLLALIALLYNQLILNWVFGNHQKFDYILLVGSWVPDHDSHVPICIWQKEELIKRGVPTNKLLIPKDIDPNLVLPMDTIDELWVAGMMLEWLGLAKQNVLIYLVGMDYHKKRIQACVDHIKAKVEEIHVISSGGRPKSNWFYNLVAWVGLKTAKNGHGLILDITRLFRFVTTPNGSWWGKREISTQFWD